MFKFEDKIQKAVKQLPPVTSFRSHPTKTSEVNRWDPVVKVGYHLHFNKECNHYYKNWFNYLHIKALVGYYGLK